MASGLILNGGQFSWNVSSHVGPGCPNLPEDVQLVQFGYYSAAHLSTPPPNCTPADMAIFRSIVPGAPYFGGPTEPLSLAIRAHQRERGGTQDGRVSPAQASGSFGEASWMILGLDYRIWSLYPNQYPRLDECPACPPALAAASKRVFSPA